MYLLLTFLERNLAERLCRGDWPCWGPSRASSRDSSPARNLSAPTTGVKLRFSNVSFRNFSCKPELNIHVLVSLFYLLLYLFAVPEIRGRYLNIGMLMKITCYSHSNKYVLVKLPLVIKRVNFVCTGGLVNFSNVVENWIWTIVYYYYYYCF